ncbi:HAUS augmin-like complex subunit 5 [Pezoporus flaviventris]|uniref:HAUS augmin-like complex subunit 5 n=1 Tax=Pezoporus flaviventris TaxID=889875 RepID=UPI002AB14C49|nr:HAUS augmin-like complex subunit 5 [Pezoporus flaviventris]
MAIETRYGFAQERTTTPIMQRGTQRALSWRRPAWTTTPMMHKGNLLWYQHLKEIQRGAGSSTPYMEVREALEQVRAELKVMGGAVGEAGAAVLKLEEALGAELHRQGAERRRGAELRALGAEAAQEGWRLRREGAQISSAHREPGPKVGLTSKLAAVCKLREEALEELLGLRPLSRPQDLTLLWLQEAKALLNQHSPEEVLEALQTLRKGYPKISPDLDPDPDAQPPMKTLIQDCWEDVGGLWDLIHSSASRLSPLRLRLLQLQEEIQQRLEGDPKAQQAARLMLEAVGLSVAREALIQQVQDLRGSPMDSPEAALGPLRRQLQEGKQRLSRRWIQLRALAASNGKLRAQLRLLQAQARGAVRLPPGLQGEGQRLQEALSMLGKERVPLPPSPAHSPLQPIRRALGMAESEVGEGP